MYAIADLNGQQMKVEEGKELFINLIDVDEGEQVAFDKVLLLDDDGKVQVGTPYLKSRVNATVLEHVKGDKVIVFKHKRRKGYKVKNGHRQQYTRIKVDSISK